MFIPVKTTQPFTQTPPTSSLARTKMADALTCCSSGLSWSMRSYVYMSDYNSQLHSSCLFQAFSITVAPMTQVLANKYI